MTLSLWPREKNPYRTAFQGAKKKARGAVRRTDALVVPPPVTLAEWAGLTALQDHRELEKSPETIWAAHPGSQSLFLSSPCWETLYVGTRGPGKMLPNDTPVLTPTGWRAHGDLHRGSWVTTPNGEKARVAHVFNHPARDVLRVVFDDGAEVLAGDEHLWKFRVVGHRRKIDERWSWDDTLAMKRHLDAGRAVLIPTVDPLEMQAPRRLGALPVDPYMLGLLLGDGCFTQRRVIYCTADDALADEALRNGFTEMPRDARNGLRNFTNPSLKAAIARLGLTNAGSHTKFVPKWYKQAPVAVRLAILQGLMDTDGTADAKGYTSFCSVSRALAEDVQYLARSLGAKATLNPKAEAYEVYIQPAGKFPLFRLARKQRRVRGYMHAELCRRVVSIEPAGKRDCTCIRIDHPSHLYVVTEGFIVTHNTDALLMDFAQHVGKGWGGDWVGVLFREEYKPLQDVIRKSLKWFPKIFPNARFYRSTSDLKWVFPDGEELLFRAFKGTEDYWNFHGHAYPWLGWEELTAWPSLAGYHMMKSTNRSARPGIPLKYRATANPYGPGHNAVKAYAVDPAPPSTPFVSDRSNASEIAKEYGIEIPEMEGRYTVCIHGHYSENTTLMEAQPDYAVQVAASAENPEQAKAWLSDDWDIVAGGMFDDVWKRARHVLPAFIPPRGWRITRSFDWGSSKPFSVGWWTRATGEAIALPNGVVFAPPRDSLIRLAEWYGWDGKTPNVGLRMTDDEIGKGIVERERALGIFGRVEPGAADASIFSADPGKPTAAATMAKHGAGFLAADKSPGSRKEGWRGMRRMLKSALQDRPEEPGLWVTELCADGFIRTVPTLPRDKKDPDDVDTNAEDHAADEARYECMATAPPSVAFRPMQSI